MPDLYNDLAFDSIEAFKEVEEIKKNSTLGKSYTNVDEMLEDLLKRNVRLNQSV